MSVPFPYNDSEDIQCRVQARMIGNRVKIPGDPVTVSGERAANAIAYEM